MVFPNSLNLHGDLFAGVMIRDDSANRVAESLNAYTLTTARSRSDSWFAVSPVRFRRSINQALF